ncbi:MAG: chromosomal replication initiator protein DnaA, partial [Bacilli bacterium]|nr:chromosomal replication initiator protein DnaA [Bacilli bacterium]
NTFNALMGAKKQIVMTSDVAPKKLPSIEERLISRFEGGMLQEIESPSYETRLAILKKKAESLDVRIPQNALEFIADNIKSHVRAMEGALGKVEMYVTTFKTSELKNDVMKHLLDDFIEKEQNLRKLSIEEIQSTVAKKYNVTIAQILSSERTQSIVTPRQLSMYIARKFTTRSLPEIAKMFDKTHATILHGVRNIERHLDVEPELREALAEILSKLGCKMSDIPD